MFKRFTISFIFILLVSVPLAAQDTAFEAAPCPVPIPFGFVEDIGPGGIQCGFVTVPENYDEPDGTQIRLGVAIINSASPSPQADPIFMEQGGPGGSSIEVFVASAPLYASLLAQRDIVIVEQRGTKFSEPFLNCPEVLDAIFESFETLEEPDDVGAMQACFDRLASEGVDLSAYNSVNNATDMITVADAFGYEQINFYGVSYGTMLGQHLLRDYEDRVRSIVFDAVVPLEQNFVPDVAINAQNALQGIFDTCAADAFCSERYPDLETITFEAYEALNAEPAMVPIIDTETGESYDLPLTGDIFLGFMRLFQYSTPLLPSVPAFIENTAEGDYEWIENLYGALNITLQRDIADAMYYGVICAEDSDFTADDVMQEGLEEPFLNSSGEPITTVLDVCQAANVELLDSYVDDPVVSDVPALIFSGELDPVTPASYGDILAGNLSNSTHIVFSGFGHGAISAGLCPIDIMTSFVNDPSATPDASCADSLSLSFNEYTVDPTGRLQFPVPTGLVDTSTDDFAQYQTEAGDLTFSLIAVETLDRDEATSEALSAIVRDGFDVPPVQTVTESSGLGDFVTNVYQDGTELVVTFTGQREGITSVVVMQFGPTQFQLFQTLLQEVALSVLVVD